MRRASAQFLACILPAFLALTAPAAPSDSVAHPRPILPSTAAPVPTDTILPRGPDTTSSPFVIPGNVSDSALDTARRVVPATIAAPGAPPAPRRWHLLAGIGPAFPSFSQRDRFSTQLAAITASESLLVDQSFQRSDLALHALAGLAWGADTGWRAVVEGGFLGWGNRAMVRDTSGTGPDRSGEIAYEARTGILSVGADIPVSPRLLTLTAFHDFRLALRLSWVPWAVLRRDAGGSAAGIHPGVTEIEGRGWGWSLEAGGDFLFRRDWSLGGRLGWRSLTIQGEQGWDALLPGTAATGRATWKSGGISFTLVSRWSLPRTRSELRRTPSAPDSASPAPGRAPAPSPESPDRPHPPAPPADAPSAPRSKE